MKTDNPISEDDNTSKVLGSQLSSSEEINYQDRAIESLISLWNKQAESPKSNEERKRLQWNNLIHIDLQFYINTYLFKDDFLWDRSRREPTVIKQFAIEIIQNNVISDDMQLKAGISSFTFEELDTTAEYVCRQILHEIKFYEMFKPYEMITNGLFGSGKGVEGEHLIDICLDIEGKVKDAFTWDIMNNYNIPEDFAEDLVIENSLDRSLINVISLSIRKQIKQYVITNFEAFAISNLNKKRNPIPKISSFSSKRKSNQKKNRSYQSKLDIFLINGADTKLNTMLGQKTNRTKEDNNAFPQFLMHKNEIRLNNTSKVIRNRERDHKTNEHILSINETIIIIKKSILHYHRPLPLYENINSSNNNNSKSNNNNNDNENDDIESKSSQAQSTSINTQKMRQTFDLTKRSSTSASSEKDFKEII